MQNTTNRDSQRSREEDSGEETSVSIRMTKVRNAKITNNVNIKG